MFWVYVIKSTKTGKCYVGHTSNLEQRISEHNAGKNISTRGKGPFQLVYSEILNSKSEAAARERQIKSYKGGNAFKNLINK